MCKAAQMPRRSPRRARVPSERRRSSSTAAQCERDAANALSHVHAPLYQEDFPHLTQVVVSVFAVTGEPTTAQMRVLRDCRRALSGAPP